MKMFNKDISYLYSDDYLTLSSSNEKECSEKPLNSLEYRPIRNRFYRKRDSTLPTGHRSKHIILFRDEDLKREKNRLLARRLREKQQLLEENLQKKIKQLEDARLYLENDLRQRQSYIKNLETEINNNFCIKSSTEFLSTNIEKMQLSSDQSSYDFELFSVSMTNISNLNNDINVNLDN